MMRVPSTVLVRRAGLVFSTVLLLLVVCAQLPWPRWCGWNDNLLTQPRWRMIVTNVNERELRMLVTPLPQALPGRLVLHGQLSAIAVLGAPTAGTERVAVGIHAPSSEDGVGSGVRLSYDDVQASRAFSGVVRVPRGETNLHLCIAHALPGVTVFGTLGVRKPVSVLQHVVVHCRRFWHVMAGMAILCAMICLPYQRAMRACMQHAWRLNPRHWLQWPAPVPPAEPYPREHAGWWLLGLIWLIVLCTLFFYYYHPHRIFINSDNGWNILEIAYHDWGRDGVVKWWTDRSGALFIIVPQLLLEGFGLKRWVPHSHVYMWYVAACLFIGTAWLGRRVRTFLVAGPLLLALCLDWNGRAKVDSTVFSFWIPKIGAVPILLVILTLIVMLWYLDRRRWSALAWASVVISATAAMVQSPGNAVVLAVWGAVLCVIMPPRRRSEFVRLSLLAVALGAAYYANQWVRTLYDHSVHVGKQTTPMTLQAAGFLRHMHMLWRALHASGPALHILLIAGGVITAVAVIRCMASYLRGATACVAMWHHRTLRCVTALGVSAVVYLVLIAMNEWVQRNAGFIVNYSIPALLLLFAACVWALQEVLVRLRGRWCIVLGSILLAAAGTAALHMRPRATSAQYRAAARLLAYTNEFNGTVPLLGDFWQTYVHSYFDPHRLLSSNIEGIGVAGLADVMLPKVLAHPRVLVTFREGAATLLVSNQPPEVFTQRGTLLVRDTDIPALAFKGWFAYRTIPAPHVLAEPDAFEHAHFEHAVNASRAPGGRLILDASNQVAEAVWSVPRLPRGMYLLALRARARSAMPGTALLVMHLMNKDSQMHAPCLVVRPHQLTSAPVVFSQATSYPGVAGRTYLRVYAHPPAVYELDMIGVYPVMPPSKHAGALRTLDGDSLDTSSHSVYNEDNERANSPEDQHEPR